MSELYGMWIAAAAKSLQSCPTLCDPIDGSPPGSSVPGILQARTLEWVAISFSRYVNYIPVKFSQKVILWGKEKNKLEGETGLRKEFFFNQRNLSACFMILQLI